MTNYTITVNGKSYDVTVQKKKEDVAAVVPVLTSYPTVASEDKKILAPMPGKIIEIKVRIGDTVKKGQELLIMEAMKMHNPILAASEGIISKLFVKVNDSVQSGQSLLSIG